MFNSFIDDSTKNTESAIITLSCVFTKIAFLFQKANKAAFFILKNSDMPTSADS